MRRNWTVPVHDPHGHHTDLLIRVPRGGGGAIWASVGTKVIKVDPEEVSNIVAAYRWAQAQALWDRGHW